MRDTVSSRAFATHTASSFTAMATGTRPTRIVLWTLPVGGSSSMTASASPSTNHTDFEPTARSVGANVRSIWSKTAPDAGSIVLVVERGREFRLAQEPGPELAVLGERGSEQLQCHLSLQRWVVSEADDAHPATTEQPVDSVAGQLRPDPRIRADAHWFAPQRLAPYRRMVKTTVYLPESLKHSVERIAALERRSEADVIRAALDEYARVRMRPRPIIPLIEGKGSPPDLAERDEEYLSAGIGQDRSSSTRAACTEPRNRSSSAR